MPIQANYLPKEVTMDTAQNTEPQHDRTSQWYTVQTYAGYERRVQQGLEQQIVAFGQHLTSENHVI
jgi:hypothetical protein